MKENSECPHCKSKSVIKWCKRKTLSRGLIQRYKCKDCKKYFTIDDGFFRMRNSPQKITLCIDLFFRGVSTRKVQEHLQAFYPHNSSWVSIYNWVVKYSDRISRYTDKLKIKSGWEVQVDEVEFHRRKHPRKHLGVAKNWFIDSIDTKTRFLVASDYVESRSAEAIRKIMLQIKDKTQGSVRMITTDGFLAYTNVVKKTFGYSNKLGRYTVCHNQVNARQGEGFNHPIERIHNNIRARTKTMRGFHGSVESARAILKGIEIYYNYITRHQGIDCTPAEKANALELKESNKWLELIELSQNNLTSDV